MIDVFEEKLIDVVGLYLNPPDKSVVLCMDEKSRWSLTAAWCSTLPSGNTCAVSCASRSRKWCRVSLSSSNTCNSGNERSEGGADGGDIT
jgi:hypothetical protein